jgi:hypothetical protein
MSMDGPKGAQLVNRFVPKSRRPEKYVRAEKRSAQWTGLLLLLTGWLLVWYVSAVGFVLIIYGAIGYYGWRCSVCKNAIDSREVTICPHCRADYR